MKRKNVLFTYLAKIIAPELGIFFIFFFLQLLFIIRFSLNKYSYFPFTGICSDLIPFSGFFCVLFSGFIFFFILYLISAIIYAIYKFILKMM